MDLIKPSVCEEHNCSNTTVRATHVDYHRPLAVRWLCALHAKRNTSVRSGHIPNQLEEQFRDYVFTQIDHTNSATRWINALKNHFNGAEISYSLLLDAINSSYPIPGLGRQFRIKARHFLDNVIKSLD